MNSIIAINAPRNIDGRVITLFIKVFLEMLSGDSTL
jgi:hypothetical protein